MLGYNPLELNNLKNENNINTTYIDNSITVSSSLVSCYNVSCANTKITNYLNVVDMAASGSILTADITITGDMQIPTTITTLEDTGSMYYDNATHTLYIYDGDTTTWYHTTLTT
jgi:myo-inositol-hexaphosphate 3-phosphohydrolase